jgi:2-oxoglutarate ferredoxin oxidoreductase subunit beta
VVKAVFKSLIEEGMPQQNLVLVSGIGCNSKIVDYLDTNSFYSLHGRATPAAEGIKLADPNLKVVVFSGDGDAYGEGLEHLVFAAKRNIDISVIVHNNRVYGLTTGQYTPTSPAGFKGRSTPAGNLEHPINPLEIMLACGATYLARGYSNNMEILKKVIKEAILHKGFSLVDVLQVCVTFFNAYDDYNKRVYELAGHDIFDYNQALAKIKEWDYNNDARIALGAFYKKEKETFEQQLKAVEGVDKPLAVKKFLEESL